MGTSRARLLRLLGVLAALALLVAACGEETTDDAADDPADDAADDPADDEDPADDDADDDPADDGDDDDAAGEGLDTVNIAMVEWAENIANTALWQEILEEEGYEVNVDSMDPGVVFQSIAAGDHDIFLDMWLPVTHAEYDEQFGDDFEQLSTWYEGEAGLNLTVPEYVDDINSIEDLVGEGERFNNTIVGIDAGSGLADTTNNEVMPGYGLDDEYEHQESSEGVMVTELDSAYQNEEDVVVTLWTPHWTYAEYDLKVLEDPEGLYGDLEEMYAITRDGLSDDDAQLVEWIDNFMMTEQELGELSALIEDEDLGLSEQEAARQWIDENQEVVDEWLGR